MSIRSVLFWFLFCVAPAAWSQSNHVYFTEVSYGAMQNLITTQRALNRELVDIERKVHTGLVRFDAVFAPLPQGQVLALIDATLNDYNAFIADVETRDGRLIDVEVDDQAGAWRFSVLFWESGETGVGWTLRTRRSRSDFLDLIAERARSNASLVDIEVSVQNGTLYYSGVWQSHSGQPRTVLYQDLAAQELFGILDWSNPRLTAGRVVDVERYPDPQLGADRFAVLVALVPGDGERYSRGINQPTLVNQHASTANAGTHLVDLERYDDSSGNLRFDALWGPGRAALLDVAAMLRDDTVVARGAELNAQIARIDIGATRTNNLGLYARNLSTRQSVSWNEDEFFPLASVVKVPIHFRLYRDVGLGLIDPVATSAAFTSCSNCTDSFAPYWVDHRAAPGLGCSDRGSSFSLARFAQGMMTVSDNAATGVLLRRAGGLAQQAFSINDWLAGLDGIAQGFGPIVSIGEIDRISYWRGQWTSACTAPTGFADSFLRAPTSAIEVELRHGHVNGLDVDVCDALPSDRFLVAHFAPNPVPARCEDDGLLQFHDMGLNSATPRALVLLYDALRRGQLVAPAAMNDLLSAMQEGTSLNVAPGFPTVDERYAKGGTKGATAAVNSTHVVTNTEMIRIGKNWYGFALFGKHLSIAANSIRTYSAVNGNYPAIAYAMLMRIAPDLRRAATLPQWQSPTTLQPGDPVQMQLRVRNEGAGPANGFRVALHLSTNPIISGLDPVVAVVDTAALGVGLERTLTLAGTLPVGIAPGNYYVGWRLDTPISGQSETTPNGQVGEWDESDASNTGHIDGLQVLVQVAPDIFADSFE